MWSDFVLKWSEVKWSEVEWSGVEWSYGDILRDESTMYIRVTLYWEYLNVPGADKSLARPGSKEARKRVRDARDFNNIETRAVIVLFFFLQGKAPKEIHAILTKTLVCFLPGRTKDLSAPLYYDYFVCCAFCTVVVWTCFVMRGWVCVGVFW